MQSKQLEFSPSSEQDLDDIWQYSVENWSIEQAERYLDLILDAAEDLASGIRNGKNADRIRKNYRVLAIESHHIYYIENEDMLVVQRVLHQSMDAGRHLADEA